MAKLETWIKMGCGLFAAVVLVAGCETATTDNQGEVSLAELQGITVEPTPTSGTTSGTDTGTSSGTGTGTGTSTDNGTGTTTTGTGTTGTTGTGTSPNSNSGIYPSEISGNVKWLNSDISSWPVTASLNASVSSSSISVPYSKARSWPSVGGVNANTWAFINIGGQWYAATWEYLKVGQQAKPACVLAKCDGKGDHFKVAPLSSWSPQHGERIGLMVSGLIRGSARNVKERSNISMVTWP